MLEINIILI